MFKWHCFVFFIGNFDNISRLALVILLLTLNRQMPAGFYIL